MSGKEAALLVATVCSSPPARRKRWTLELLSGAMVGLTEREGLSRETVRRRLAEDDLKPWLRKMWCIPHVDGAYVARIEDVLDLYAEEADPSHPVCFDESPTQLIGAIRQPIPAALGQPERNDCEYRRNGTANLFVFLDARKPWRHVKVTDHRTARDFADCMRDLSDVRYSHADRIRVVMDDLPLARLEPCTELSRRRKHAACCSARSFTTHRSTRAGSTWGEIEIGVLRGQCLDRRIGERDVLVSEIDVW